MVIRNASAVLAAAALFALAPGHAFAQAAQVEIEAEGPIIHLSVFESVTAEPDLVTIGAGVTSEAPTAVAALRANAAEMQRVIDRILALGVEEEDIQTTGINLSARYVYDRGSDQQVFRGYQVSNRVSVRLRDIEETGAVLDALVTAGATDLSGPSFSIEDDEAAKDLARERAIERAQARALSYAQMLGYDEVRVLEISETIQGSGPGPQAALRSLDVAEAAAAPLSPVQPGRVSTGVAISITFEMVELDAAEAAIDALEGEDVSS